MSDKHKASYFILGLLLAIGIIVAAMILGKSAITYKEYERTVSVKGLSEREVDADLVVWPIRFSVADNDLTALYQGVDKQVSLLKNFLNGQGFTAEEVIVSSPYVTDKLAQSYGSDQAQFRYIANQVITVRTMSVKNARKAMNEISALGKEGIAFGGSEYDQPQFSYTKLNDIKPSMVEEATQSAREVANKFASDSNSRLGKIKSANQGQFSIDSIDNSTPHIKKVRVVSTVEYYLSD